MLAAARVWFSMSRDGLLPGWFAKVHPRFRTPYRPTLILGLVTAFVAGFTPINEVAELVNIGTLSAFIVICGSIMILRRRNPDLPRKFRTPWVPFIPLVGIGFSIWLIVSLPPITWIRFAAWLVIGMLVYYFYGMRNSKLAKQAETKE
jgi:basic amino acid/polyamine antiporter, APA family